VRAERLAAPQHLSRVGVEHAHDDAHRGRLAGAVGPYEAEHLPRPDAERHPVEGHRGAEAFTEPVNFQHPFLHVIEDQVKCGHCLANYSHAPR
jgi:hypothetical protein